MQKRWLALQKKICVGDVEVGTVVALMQVGFVQCNLQCLLFTSLVS